jgi:hypothetical protein
MWILSWEVWVLMILLPTWVVISGVDPQTITTVVALTSDAPSVEPKFMPEYDATFGDERAEESADDRPVLELSNRDNVLLQRALAEYVAEVPDCWDLSQAHSVVADGLQLDASMPLVNRDNVIIWKGIISNYI